MANTKAFSFEHDGKTYEFEKGFDVVATPKFLRANRRRDALDMTFTILEEVAGDEALEAIDGMGHEEFSALSKRLEKAIEDAMSA